MRAVAFITLYVAGALLAAGCRTALDTPQAPPPPAPAASAAPAPPAAPAPSAEPAVAPAALATPAAAPEPVSFEASVKPLLARTCTPCHVPGGRMYERLPFDRQETIRTLGKGTLTRLRDPVDQELMRTFLEQRTEEPGAHPAP